MNRNKKRVQRFSFFLNNNLLDVILCVFGNLMCLLTIYWVVSTLQIIMHLFWMKLHLYIFQSLSHICTGVWFEVGLVFGNGTSHLPYNFGSESCISLIDSGLFKKTNNIFLLFFIINTCYAAFVLSLFYNLHLKCYLN
jgi:hypothetical protein